MTIQNKDKFYEEHWDWGFFRDAGCFGKTKIEPTDIDGLTERKGNYFFLEAKSPGVPINKGQEILHKSLVRTGAVTVVRFWGHAPTLTVVEIEVLSPFGNIPKKPANLNYLIEVGRHWFEKADKNPHRPVDITFLNRRIAHLTDQVDAVKGHMEQVIQVLGGSVSWR